MQVQHAMKDGVPRGSIKTANMELGPKNHIWYGFWALNEPSGDGKGRLDTHGPNKHAGMGHRFDKQA